MGHLFPVLMRVALYATWLARSLTYGSVANYLSGLSYFLKQNGHKPVDYDQFIVSATLQGIKRVKGNTPRRAAPLLPIHLSKIFVNLRDGQGHTSWRAVILTSFRALLRKSQVTLSDQYYIGGILGCLIGAS